MLKRATTLLMLLIMTVLVGDTFAQTAVTVREINAIPQSQIDQLMNLGAALTGSDVSPSSCTGLIYDNTLCGQEVRFTAVVMSDPLNSGLASINSTTGLPGRLHIFVRDVAADTEGNEGHGIQIVDGSNLGMESLIKGDVIEVVGTISPFNTTMQINPTSFQVTGSRPATDAIFDPILVTSADINQDMGPDGAIQVNWANFANIRGNLIQMQNATVLTRTVGSRPDYNVSTDNGASSVSGYDTSLRFRNDREGSYPASYNVRSSDFTPPPAGAKVTITGFLTLTGGTGSDPFNLGVPNGMLLAINPFDDSDITVTESPPAISDMTRPSVVPGAGLSTITAVVAADPSRTIATASLIYFTSSDATEMSVASSSQAGDVYTFEIPAAADGDFITYWIHAVDNTGALSDSDRLPLRSLAGGITSISHIQQTADGGVGSSPFFGMEVDMNITATVQFSDGDTGNVTLQDDAGGAAWSGIVIENPNSSSGLQPLNAGDVINITHAAIFERFGLTEIDDNGIVFTVVSTGGATIAPRMITTDVLSDPDLAEGFEGVLVEVDDPTVMATNADDPGGPFGEFTISSDGTAGNAVRVDDESSAVSYAGGDPATLYAVGEQLDFVRGVLWYSFSNFKITPASFDDIGPVINTATEDAGLPATFTLDQNYPNPFNPSTQITFDVASTGHVLLEVFDVLGRQVATLVNNDKAVGTHTVTFDARGLSSGVYVYRLSSGSNIQTRKMLLMK